jgi:hypothetical protein
MGGKALEKYGIKPKRITTEEQTDLLHAFQNATSGLFQKVEAIKTTPDKKTHGDTDLACLILPQTKESIQQILLETLNPKAYHRNDNILSLEFHGTQFDLALHTNPQEYKSHLQFCHYSPLGNILGQLIRQTGAKYTLKGLYLPLLPHKPPLLLTQNMEAILKLAGLSYQKWAVGFQTQKELHSYCLGSLLMNSKMFRQEELNHKNRKRLSQRADYQTWIEKVQTAPPIQNTPQRTSSEWREILEKHFPEAKIADTWKKTLHEQTQAEENKKKFNGKIFQQISGLNGPLLGEAIKKFKHEIEKTTPFAEWVANTSTKNIRNAIEETIYPNQQKAKKGDTPTNNLQP